MGLKFGTSGHPLNTRPYNANGNAITYEMQADLLKKIGAKLYRMDVATNSSGKSTNHARFLDIIGKCTAVDCEVLPMIYDRVDYDATDQENYDIGFKQLQGFVTQYGGLLQHVELGNELGLFDKIKNKTGPGDKESHYYPEKVASALAYMKGAHAGVRSVNQTIKILTPGAAGFFPILFYDKILEEVPFDILSWHVYDEMDWAYREHFDINNILNYLQNRYNLPIWITETGTRYRKDETPDQNEYRQLNWHKKFYAQCVASPVTEVYIHHDLLNVVTKTTEKGWEENYGMYKFDGIDLTAEKPDYVGTIKPKKLALYLIEQAKPEPEPPIEEPEPPIDEPQPEEPEETTVRVTGITWTWKSGLTMKFTKA